MIDPSFDPESPFDVFADEATRVLTTRTIRSLQALRETHLQSGADSGLRDAWDEICVQVQEEYSLLWEAYAHTIRAVLEKHCDRLPPRDLHSIWRRTGAASDWLQDVEVGLQPDEGQPYCVEEVVEEVMEKILWEAGDWSNHRIRQYLDRH